MYIIGNRGFIPNQIWRLYGEPLSLGERGIAKEFYNHIDLHSSNFFRHTCLRLLRGAVAK